MFGLLAFLLASVQPPVPPADAPVHWIEDGRIVAVEAPPAFSGIIAFYAHFDVARPGGAPQRLYLLYMGQTQNLPRAGETCTIGYRREALLPQNWHRHEGRTPQPDGAPHNVIQQLGCGRAPNPAPVGQGPY